MNKPLTLLLIPFLMTSCKTISSAMAELTGDTSSTASTPVVRDRRDARTLVIDEKIEDDALIKLNSNPEIQANAHFNVNSYNGIVLITGETLSPDISNRITTEVQSLADVRHVQNHMMLLYPTSFSSRASDGVMTEKIKAALGSDPRLPGFDVNRIKIVTENGRVFLMGQVYKTEGDLAADIARQQPYVREVIKVFEYLGY